MSHGGYYFCDVMLIHTWLDSMVTPMCLSCIILYCIEFKVKLNAMSCLLQHKARVALSTKNWVVEQAMEHILS